MACRFDLLKSYRKISRKIIIGLFAFEAETMLTRRCAEILGNYWRPNIRPLGNESNICSGAREFIYKLTSDIILSQHNQRRDLMAKQCQRDENIAARASEFFLGEHSVYMHAVKCSRARSNYLRII